MPTTSPVVGSDAVAKAPPDGHTILLSNIASQAIAPAVSRNVPYDPLRDLAPVGLIAAIAISATVVDVSPFSTNGALVVANAPEEGREVLYKRFLIYSILVVLAGPLLAWLVLVLPGWV